MRYEVIKTIVHPDGKRRVVFTCRSGKQFKFGEDYFSEEPLEQCWIPKGSRGETICDSLETAMREAKGRIKWLSEMPEAN